MAVTLVFAVSMRERYGMPGIARQWGILPPAMRNVHLASDSGRRRRHEDFFRRAEGN
jgi:hypothetical protein